MEKKLSLEVVKLFEMEWGRVKGLQTSPSAMHDLQFSPQQKGAVNDPLVIAWHFTLDDVSGSVAEGYEFVSGSRQGEDPGTNVQSVTAASASYSGALDAGLDRFTTVLHGGYEGFDVQEKDPFRNTGFNTANDEKQSYQLHTLRRAINIVSDKEDSQYNVITLPGIIQNNVTEHLLDVVEESSMSSAGFISVSSSMESGRVIRASVRDFGSIVVSLSCEAFISPRPLKRPISTFSLFLNSDAISSAFCASSIA